MYNLELFLLLHLMMTLISSSCGPGTLACSKVSGKPKPTICDFYNSFILDPQNLICVKREIPFCQIPSLPNSSKPCFLCQAKYIFDKEANKCVPVQPDSLKENCQRYSSSNFSCQECSEKHYLTAGSCLPVPGQPIDSCAVYKSATQCLHCNPQTLLTNGNCQLFDPLPNCFQHRNLACDRCKDQFFSNPNANPLFNQSSFAFGGFDFSLFVKQNPDFEYWTTDFSAPICQEGSVGHCRVYKSFSECKECQEGYYVNTSGRCDREQEEPIAKCQEYHSATQCSKCQYKFYLEVSSGKCSPVREVSNCAEYHVTQNKCISCDQRHFLSASGNCLSPRVKSLSIKKCLERATDRDECGECLDGYSLSTDKLKCYADIQHCKVHLWSNGTTATHTCSQCDEGFHPSETKAHCQQTKISRCLEIAANRNFCTKCEEGYYFDDENKTCAKQFKENCAEYKSQTNICVKCENLFYLQNGEYCVAINMNQFCVESDGTSNQCSKCSPLYLKKDNLCDISQKRNSDVLDRQCVSNSETEITSNCTDCGPDNSMLLGTSRAQSAQFLSDNNCVRVDNKTGECSQCVPNSEGNNGKCDAPNINLTTDCLQLAEGQFGSLSNGLCAQCRDPLKQYLDAQSQICRNRSNISVTEHCDEVPVDDSDCRVCKPQFFPVREDSYHDGCLQMANYPGFRSISNCVIYDMPNLKCFLCRDQYILSADGRTCLLDLTRVNVFFDRQMNLISTNIPKPTLDQCSAFHQLDLNVVRCVQCQPNFVKIVSLTLAPGSSFLYHFESLSQNNGLKASALPVESCESYLNSFFFQNDTRSIVSDSCAVGVRVQGAQGFACLRCKAGYNGTVRRLTKDRLGEPLQESIFGVTECEPDTAILSSFAGLGYQHRFLANMVPYSTFVQFTNCKDSSKQLVFNSIVRNDSTLELKEFRSNIGFQKVFSCVSLSQSNAFVQKVPHCQIYAFTSPPPDNYNPVNPPVDACLACKPNYKAVLSAGNRIEQCEPITDCQTTANAVLMNGCQFPRRGFQLESLDKNQLIVFHDLKGNDALGSCQVFSADLTKCVKCLPDFTLVNDKCQFIKMNVGNSRLNCRDPALGFNKLTLEHAVNRNLRLMNYLILLDVLLQKQFISRKSVCMVCNSGYEVGIDTNKTKAICQSSQAVSSELLLPNCAKYNARVPVSCAECKSGYIPNEFDGQCVSKSGHDHCRSVDGYQSKRCTQCDEGFAVDLTGKCVPVECSRFLQGECTLCNDNKKHNGVNAQYCVANLDSLDPCLAYSPTLGTCGKCSQRKVLYLFYEQKNDQSTLAGFSCDDANLNLIPINEPGWRDYNLQEVYIEVTLNTATKSVINQLRFINNDDLSVRLFQNENVQINPAAQHCFPRRNVENCLPESLLGGTLCTKCTNGFIIDPATNSCRQGKFKGCQIYLSENVCQECQSTHYLVGTICQPYSDNMNCKEADPFKNQCRSCEPNHFLNFQKRCELFRSDINCDRFVPNENKCASCPEGFVLNVSSRTCVKRVAKNCGKENSISDKCDSCKPGSWMQSKVLGVCAKSTPVEECAEYSVVSDECQKCSPDFYVVQQGKKCKHKPDGIIGCRTYSDFGVCSGCKQDHYLVNNQCFQVSAKVENCVYYEADGICSVCAESYFLTPSKKCEITEISNCLEYFTKTQCKRCRVNHVLVWTDNSLKCEESGIDGCLKALGGVPNICIECEPELVLSTDKTRCESDKSVIPFCEIFKSENQCKECKLGFVRSKNWNVCEKRTQSSSTVSTNCLSEVISRKTSCDLCKPGFKLNEKGECVSCGGNGCAICGSGLTNCSLCQKSFFMNSDLKCVLEGDSVASPSS